MYLDAKYSYHLCFCAPVLLHTYGWVSVDLGKNTSYLSHPVPELLAWIPPKQKPAVKMSCRASSIVYQILIDYESCR